MADYDIEALRLFEEEGKSYGEIADILDISYKRVNHALDRARRQRKDREEFIQKDDTPLSDKILSLLRKGPTTVENLSEKLDRGKPTIRKEVKSLKGQGYDVQDDGGSLYLENTPVEDNFIHKLGLRGNKLKFGLLGDTQLGSKYQQLTYLHDVYDIFENEGIKKVFHSGDIIDGEDMYQGHRYELHTIGSDAQIEYAVENYPRRDGIETEFITGNHDLCYYKKQGRDIGVSLANLRPDFKYLGQISAYVEIANGVFLYLLHPDGGGAYAVSYKPQKIAASFIGGDKPNIMALGHWHQGEYLFERNIHIIQTMCFQGQTPYLRRKALMPKIGGWVCEIELEDSSVRRFKQEAIVYFKEIRNDF